jgi:hypothetical protein
MERHLQHRERMEAIEQRWREAVEHQQRQVAEERQLPKVVLAATEATWGRRRMRWQ